MHKNSRQNWTLPFIKVDCQKKFDNIDGTTPTKNNLQNSNYQHQSHPYTQIIIPKWERIPQKPIIYNRSYSLSYHRLFRKYSLPKGDIYQPDEIHAPKFKIAFLDLKSNILNQYILAKAIQYFEHSYSEQGLQNLYLKDVIDAQKQPQVHWLYWQFGLESPQQEKQLTSLLYTHWKERKKRNTMPLLRKYWSWLQHSQVFKSRNINKPYQTRYLRTVAAVDKHVQTVKQQLKLRNQELIQLKDVWKTLTLEVQEDIQSIQQQKNKRRLYLLRPKNEKWKPIFYNEQLNNRNGINWEISQNKHTLKGQEYKEINKSQKIQDCEQIQIISENYRRNYKRDGQLQSSSIQYGSTKSIIECNRVIYP